MLWWIRASVIKRFGIDILNAAVDSRIRYQTIRRWNRLNFVKANDWDRAIAGLFIIMNSINKSLNQGQFVYRLFADDGRALGGSELRVLEFKEAKTGFSH